MGAAVWRRAMRPLNGSKFYDEPLRTVGFRGGDALLLECHFAVSHAVASTKQ
jgi:hypothetical protein